VEPDEIYCSIVIPVRNEAENIAILLPQIVSVVNRYDPDLKYEILVIDHISTDNTPALLHSFQKEHPNLQVLTIIDPSIRLGDAFLQGFQAARGEFIITMDGDRSHPPEFLIPILEHLKSGYDLIIGGRYLRKQPPFEPKSRYRISKMFNLGPRLLLRKKISDYTTGYRAFKKELLSKCNLISHDFNIHVELNMKLAQLATKSIEIPIRYEKRVEGRSKLKYRQQFWGYFKAMLHSIHISKKASV
jgi:dolichol-phosphate mannosyltransferase